MLRFAKSLLKLDRFVARLVRTAAIVIGIVGILCYALATVLVIYGHPNFAIAFIVIGSVILLATLILLFLAIALIK